MATSARYSALQERRKALKIKVLAPSDSAVSTIAKTTARNEYEGMINKYNNGEVSNETMKEFLTNSLANPYITEAEKVDITDSLADFDSRILKDQLEVTYKAAPDNSPQQLNAAQALANYFSQRASSMEPGTPAQSQALENAAVYQQKITDISTNMAQQQRLNQRYMKEAEVNTYPSNTSQYADAKANTFLELSNSAATDGDMVEANRYYSQYESWFTKAGQLREAETERSIKEENTLYEKEQLSIIAGYKDKSPSEIQAKIQLYNDMAKRYFDAGNMDDYYKYTAKATQANETLQAKYAGNAAKAAKDDMTAMEKDIREITKAYSYGTKYKTPSGEEVTVTGEMLAKFKTEAYQYLTEYAQEQASNDVKGMEAKAAKYQGLLDEATELLQRYENGELADVISAGAKGQSLTKAVDISDPKERKNYVKGDNYWYKLNKATPEEFGKSKFTQKELEEMFQQRRASLDQDDNGNFVDKSGKPIIYTEKGWFYPQLDPITNEPELDEKGQMFSNELKPAIPAYTPANYVMVSSPSGSQKVWQSVNEKGELVYSRDMNKENVPLLAGSEQLEPQPYTLKTQENLLAARQKPEAGQEVYYGVNESGKPFSETRQATVVAKQPDVVQPQPAKPEEKYAVTPQMIQQAAPYTPPKTQPVQGLNFESTPVQYPTMESFKPYTAAPSLDLGKAISSGGVSKPVAPTPVVQPKPNIVQTAVKTGTDWLKNLGTKISKLKFW